MSVSEVSVPSFDLPVLSVTTADGPLGAPIAGEDGQPNTYAWIYADKNQGTISAVEVAVVAEAEVPGDDGAKDGFAIIAGSLTEAHLGEAGGVFVRAGYLTSVHAGVIPDRSLFDTVNETSRPCVDAPDQSRAVAHMCGIVAKVIAFNMSDAARQ